jgi:predicted aspartyl protease
MGDWMASSSRERNHPLACLLIALASCTSSIVVRSSDIVSDDPDETLSEIVIKAPEPRFVAPTRRDQIGRIWAPVIINGKGPFRLALDTGASRSGISADVAETLALSPDTSRSVLLRGAMGSIAVPTVHVDSFEVGDVIETPVTLPILPTALGGAEGVLGMEGFVDKRVFIDFGHDVITITRSHLERAPRDFTAIPVERSASNLLLIRAVVGGVRVQAFIDTGAQTTIGNEAMRAALVRRHAEGASTQVTDVTTETQNAEVFPCPPIELGSIHIRMASIIYRDLPIFEHWHLSREPALLVGMDALGLLDVFIIDYRRHELQLRVPAPRNRSL